MPRVKIKVRKPWISIWIRPKQTIVEQVKEEGKKRVNLLFMLAGIVITFDRAANLNWGVDLGLFPLVIMIILIGALVGSLLFNILCGAFFFIGKILNGEATFPEIKSVVGWSLVPAIYLIIVWFVRILIFGNELFIVNESILEASYAKSFLMMFTRLIEVMIGIYSIGIAIVSLAFVQDFSLRKAAFNVLFALLLLTFLALITINIIRFFAVS